MKKNILFFCFIFCNEFCFSQVDYAGLVNPFIGTGGHGHTYPGATLPYGMVQLSPDTRIDGSWDGCGGYHHSDSVIYGFSHTHLSGTGCSDYGDILLMPFSGTFDPLKKVSSTFSHEHESASPGYYSVLLDEGKINVELTTSLRSGLHSYLFSKTDQARVLLDLVHRDEVIESSLRFIDKTHVEGFRRSKAWAQNQVVYFAIEFSKPYEDFHGLAENYNQDELKHITDYYGKNVKCAFRFTSDGKEALLVKVGISSVSTHSAWLNLKAEIPGWNFEQVKSNAHAIWNRELSRIEVKGGSPVQQSIFYSALYHCMVVPNIFSDIDGSYRGRDYKIYKADGYNQYTVFSLWDTFRAWHPLMTIIDRKRTLDYIKTFLAQYEQSGLLPVWELWANETECMIGYHSIPVIVDAAFAGINNFDMEKALTAMKKSAESTDRYGLGSYIDHAYLDVEDEPESVSKTLEYAYDDWCIARFAMLLNKKDDVNKYLLRSQYWKNLFDPSTKFLRPRKNGGWLSPFDPYQVNNNFTEANAWQYSFFVPQDIQGLINAQGGSQAFDAKLDSLFSTHSQTTGREQADITGLIGQYAHGNEPSHHMAYLYNYVAKPWKTQERVHQIMSTLYKNDPDGLSGNEDCGQMSAWYVMSALGFYCVTPGSGYYVFGTPQFPEVVLHLENGKSFTIKAEGVSESNYYIQSSTLNDSVYNRYHISYARINDGGELNFKMGAKPLTFGVVQLPPSTMPKDAGMFIRNPVIEAPSLTFKDSEAVKISADGNSKIYYTLDGRNPDTTATLYTSLVVVNTDVQIKAIAVYKNQQSKITTAHFHKLPHPDWKIQILSKYNPQYTAGGDDGIIDGVRADANWRKGGWQGYQGQDFTAIIDMGKETKLSQLGAGFLQDTRSWILMPKSVEFGISTDGKNYSKVLKLENSLPDTALTSQVKDFIGDVQELKARFIKIQAVNYGQLPAWHAGAGGEAYIFVDEILVNEDR